MIGPLSVVRGPLFVLSTGYLVLGTWYFVLGTSLLRLLPTASCLLPTASCLLPTASCLLLLRQFLHHIDGGPGGVASRKLFTRKFHLAYQVRRLNKLSDLTSQPFAAQFLLHDHT
jgi:hypothetical protein